MALDTNRPFLGLQRAQADLDRELAAVLAQAVQLQPCPHGAGAWFGKKIAPVVGVPGAEALGHQQLDGLPQQLVAAPAEQFDRLGVDKDDAPLAVDDDHGVRRGLQQVLELLVGALAVGDVADGAHHHGALFGVDGAQADLDRKLATILAQAMQLQPRPHGAGAWLAKKAAAVAQVGAAVAVGQQHLHRLPQQFGTGVAKHPLGLGVDEHDAPGHVDHHDRIGGGFEQIAKPCLQQLRIALHLELRDILLARQEVQHLTTGIAHGLGRYIDVHQRAILATAHRLLHRGTQAQGLGPEKVLFVRAALGHDEVEDGAPLHFGLRIPKDQLGRRIPLQHHALGRQHQQCIGVLLPVRGRKFSRHAALSLRVGLNRGAGYAWVRPALAPVSVFLVWVVRAHSTFTMLCTVATPRHIAWPQLQDGRGNAMRRERRTILGGTRQNSNTEGPRLQPIAIRCKAQRPRPKQKAPEPIKDRGHQHVTGHPVWVAALCGLTCCRS